MNKFLFYFITFIMTNLLSSCGQDRPSVNSRGENRDKVERQALVSYGVYINAVGDTACELASGFDSAEEIAIAATILHRDLLLKNIALASEFITWNISDPVKRQRCADKISRQTLDEAMSFAIAVVVRERSKKLPPPTVEKRRDRDA